MFQRIAIELTGPICSCRKQNLGWTPYIDNDRRFGLVVNCGTCGTELRIPNGQFKAYFDLDEEYPEGRDEKKDAKILRLAPAPAEEKT